MIKNLIPKHYLALKNFHMQLKDLLVPKLPILVYFRDLCKAYLLFLCLLGCVEGRQK
jgi:hypothetical protein